MQAPAEIRKRMHKIPESLINDLKSVKGFDEDAFLEAHQKAPVTSVRLNPEKRVPVFKEAMRIPWYSDGLYLKERPVFTLDPLFHAGAYYVQEASSMFLDYLVRSILPERNNLRVLDLCAAPGGKSTLLASVLDKDSLLISNEVIRTRASILEENIARWGYMNNWVTSNDPKDFGKLDGYFDLIVVDAPCSGSGLFRKDERAVNEWSEANVLLCSQRQQRIVSDVWSSLKEAGFLIYATCSYSPQEDEEILSWLSENFEVSPVNVTFPKEWGIITSVTKEGLNGYRFFPDKVNGEGFFIAAVQKKESAKALALPRFRTLHDKKAADQSAILMDVERDFSVLNVKDGFVAIEREHEGDFHLLSKHLYLRKTGIALGSPANKEWIPAHDVALSIDRSSHIPSVAVTKEQALRFLKKEDMNLALSEKGWMLIAYEGLGLGWIKSLGNRINNYLPKHWRIRMELPSDWD